MLTPCDVAYLEKMHIAPGADERESQRWREDADRRYDRRLARKCWWLRFEGAFLLAGLPVCALFFWRVFR